MSGKISIDAFRTIESSDIGGQVLCSIDGRVMVSVIDNSIAVMDAASGSRIGTYSAAEGEEFTHMCATGTAERLFIGLTNKRVRRLRVDYSHETSKCEISDLGSFGSGLKRDLRAIRCSGDGSLVVLFGDDGTMRVCDPATGGLIESVDGVRLSGSALCTFCRESNDMFSLIDAEESLRVYSIVAKLAGNQGHGQSGQVARQVKLVAHLPIAANSAVRALCFPMENIVATGGLDCMVTLWSPEAGRWKVRKQIATREIVSAMEVLSDLTVIVAGSDSGTLKVFSRSASATSEVLYVLSCETSSNSSSSKKTPSQTRSLTGIVDPGRHSLANSLLSEFDLVAVGDDDSIVRWAVRRSRDPATKSWKTSMVQVKRFLSSLGSICSVAFNQKGKLLAVASGEERVRVLDSDTGNDRYSLEGHKEGVLCVSTVSCASGSVLFATGSRDKTIRIFQRAASRSEGLDHADESLAHTDEDFKKPVKLEGHVGPVTGLTFLSESELVSVGDDGYVKYWKLSSKKSSGEKVWKSKWSTLAHEKSINHIVGNRASLASSSERLVASSSLDRTAKVILAESGAVIGTCKGHKRGVWSSEFYGNSQVLVTACGDHSVRLFQISATSGGDESREFPCFRVLSGAHSHPVLSLLVTPSKVIVSADANGVMAVWRQGDKKPSCTLTGSHAEEAKIWALVPLESQTDELGDQSSSETGLSSTENGLSFLSAAEDGKIVFYRDTTEAVSEASRESLETHTNLVSQIYRHYLANEQVEAIAAAVVADAMQVETADRIKSKNLVSVLEICLKPDAKFMELHQTDVIRLESFDPVFAHIETLLTKPEFVRTGCSRAKLAAVVANFAEKWLASARLSHVATAILLSGMKSKLVSSKLGQSEESSLDVALRKFTKGCLERSLPLLDRCVNRASNLLERVCVFDELQDAMASMNPEFIRTIDSKARIALEALE